MKRAWLHEIAKVCLGLVIADFFMLWWLMSERFSQTSFLGITITPDMVGPAMVIDIFLMLFLVHYSWNVGKMPRVKERMYLMTAGVIFTIVCLAHLVRILAGSSLVIMGWAVPMLLSWVGVFVTLYLAYASFHLASRRSMK